MNEAEFAEDALKTLIAKKLRGKGLSVSLEVLSEYKDASDTFSVKHYIINHMRDRGPAFMLALWIETEQFSEKSIDPTEFVKALVEYKEPLPHYLSGMVVMYFDIYWLDGVPKELVPSIRDFINKNCNEVDKNTFFTNHPYCK